MKNLRVLLLGQSRQLVQALPYLFSRAGFEVDAITYYDCIIASKLISNFRHCVNCRQFIEVVQSLNLDEYDLIVPFDDAVLKDIVESDLMLEKKLKLLPINSEKDFKHLSSKIGLLEVLSENDVLVPQSFVAKNLDEAIQYAEILGFPILVKVDFSSGGSGVFECNVIDDLRKIPQQSYDVSVLVQKKITGQEHDLSAFYQGGKLVDFNYSKVLKRIGKFEPASLRLYKRFSDLDENLITQMQKLGEALGADGFVNISAMKCDKDGQLYFFEADVRPNVWADFGKFIGNDIAVKISNYFNNPDSWQINKKFDDLSFPAEMIIPQYCRLKFWEVLCNRYNVWQFVSRDDLVWYCKNYLKNLRNSAAIELF